MLIDLDLAHVYGSEKYNLVNDLMIPLLKESVLYSRGVGYFTSSWLKIAASGIHQLVKNGGKAKYVISPVMDNKDWEAFQLGAEAQRNTVLRNVLKNNIKEIESGLRKDTLNTLACLDGCRRIT